MKIGIMQPYFFPYLGYFSLIKHTNKFILLDTVQFIRHGWIERNRILRQDEGWLYIKVPLIKELGRNTLIKDSKIDNTQNWKQKILAQLQSYKKTAPNYFKVLKIVNEALNNDFLDICSLNKNVLENVCDYLGIRCSLEVFSKMNIKIEPPSTPDEWALNICKMIEGVNEYWNPTGGIHFFDRSKYDKCNIQLKFHSIRLREYNQKRKNFESGLSIIDVMMFNCVDEINKMLDDYELS